MSSRSASALALAALLGFPALAAAVDKDPPKGGAAPCATASCCPHGALQDPHRGFVRCLAKDEDPGPMPTERRPAASAAPSAAPSGAPSAVAPGAEPAAKLDKTEAQNGTIPNLERSLEKLLPALSKCVGEAGGLAAGQRKGTLKLELLVRARGVAEGVEVTEAKNVAGSPQACVKQAVRGKRLGIPSADPVGVKVTVALERK